MSFQTINDKRYPQARLVNFLIVLKNIHNAPDICQLISVAFLLCAKWLQEMNGYGSPQLPVFCFFKVHSLPSRSAMHSHKPVK